MSSEHEQVNQESIDVATAESPVVTDTFTPALPHGAKNIVICCDGTSNEVAGDATNVLHLFRSLSRSEAQLTWYDSGVGVLADPTRVSRVGKFCSQMLDRGIGHSVRENVCRAYRFLVRKYQPGDRIFLFGFSRGAYTVRALAGMIHLLGLVRPELEDLDRLGWSVFADDYRKLKKTRFHIGNRFQKSFARDEDVRIHFVGAWDTVSSFGAPWSPRSVPNASHNPSIDHIRHAVSIDELRVYFQRNLFVPKDLQQHTSFKQIWFAGSHGDVGGGFPEEESGLAKLSLEWMFEEATQLGCLFEADGIDQFLGRSARHSKMSQPNPLAKAHLGIRGALYNSLEFLPQRCWDPEQETFRWSGPHLSKPRTIPEESILHPSVEIKLAKDPLYRPKNLPQSYTFGK